MTNAPEIIGSIVLWGLGLIITSMSIVFYTYLGISIYRYFKEKRDNKKNNKE